MYVLRKQCVNVSVGFISSGQLLILQEWIVSGDQEAADHTMGALMAGCVTQAATKRSRTAECR